MDRKIKILQFPIANSNGGITHYAMKNWQYMDKGKFQCDFATVSKHLDFEWDILATGSKIHYISCYAEENAQQFEKEFREILQKGNYDVLHLHTGRWKSLFVERIAKELRVKKVIIHAHNTGIDILDEEKRKVEIMRHNSIKAELTQDMATDFWACSRKAAEFLFGNKIPQERIKIMKNAIEIEQFQYNEIARQETRKEFGVEDKFVIGHIGRFVYQKNHEFLIEMFAQLCRKEEKAVLFLVGDGELRDAVYKKAVDLGIEGKVIFAGKRDDVYKLLQGMDIFCFPSRFEGLPISLIEVQASDLLCLYSDTITDEIELIDKIFRLPLDKDMWVEKILDLRNKAYENRKDRISEMMKKGYDIKLQIRNIEKEYMEGGGII